MTSRRGWLALAGCLALVIVPAATAARSRTIVVISNTVALSRHDVAPKGASKGDTVVYRDRLVNAAAQFGKQKGALVGSDAGTLTFTSGNTAGYKGTARLPGGTLRISGDVYTSTAHELVFQVTGGTGAFAGATGTLTVGTGKDHVLNTYRLSSNAAPIA
jgi:hypothetical protein